MIEAEEIQLTDTDYREAAGRLFRAQKIEGYEPKALHLYRDADGHPIYGRVRMHKPKEGGGYEKLIRPFWHNGTDWKHGEPKQEGGKVLYGLPDLIAHPAVPVYVVEGEQKADALTKIGAGQARRRHVRRLYQCRRYGLVTAGGPPCGPLAGSRCTGREVCRRGSGEAGTDGLHGRTAGRGCAGSAGQGRRDGLADDRAGRMGSGAGRR